MPILVCVSASHSLSRSPLSCDSPQCKQPTLFFGLAASAHQFGAPAHYATPARPAPGSRQENWRTGTRPHTHGYKCGKGWLFHTAHSARLNWHAFKESPWRVSACQIVCVLRNVCATAGRPNLFRLRTFGAHKHVWLFHSLSTQFTFALHFYPIAHTST